MNLQKQREAIKKMFPGKDLSIAACAGYYGGKDSTEFTLTVHGFPEQAYNCVQVKSANPDELPLLAWQEAYGPKTKAVKGEVPVEVDQETSKGA